MKSFATCFHDSLSRKTRPSKGKLVTLALGVILTSSFALTAHAQEADGTVLELEEIIVTANRREQSIQDVSGVVQTISADDIRKSGITEFRQLQIAVPGLSIGNQLRFLFVVLDPQIILSLVIQVRHLI